jgi:hypothetical protein
VEFDISAERFHIRHDPRRISTAGVLAIVRRLGYEPNELTDPTPVRAVLEGIDPALLPADLRTLFARAKERGCGLLLDFVAPG